METISKHCKGCITFKVEHTLRLNSTHVLTCNFSYFNKDGRCPCVKCIIKMMCMTTCQAMSNWATLVKNAHEKEYYKICEENDRK